MPSKRGNKFQLIFFLRRIFGNEIIDHVEWKRHCAIIKKNVWVQRYFKYQSSDIPFLMVYRTIIYVILHLFIICNDLWCQLPFFTRGQFWPSGIVVACVCVSVSLCVNHLLVRAITRDPFKLGSPNLKHRCKRPWLRSLLFWRVIDLYLQGQIYLQSQNLPHFELVRAITHHPFKLGPPNLDQRCKIPWLRSLLFWGLIELDMSN